MAIMDQPKSTAATCITLNSSAEVWIARSKMRFTFYLPELVERLEAGRVVDVVGVERDAEEAAIRADGLLAKVGHRAAKARHLAVHQLHVEVGKLDVVALRRFVATARHVAASCIIYYDRIIADFKTLFIPLKVF